MSHSFQSKRHAAKYHGLVNQGATCYLNSILQVLFMTADFRERVKSHTRNNAETEYIDSKLHDLFTKLKQNNAHTKDVMEKLKINNAYEQRDAAEYYEKILRLASPKTSQIFHGELINRNKCLKCKTQTESEAGFWHLPLPLVDSNKDYSVEKGIKDFFHPSVISGDDQMYCETCDEKCDAVLDCKVKHHPEVLVLLLKRFEIDYKYMRKVKICCPVKMPDTLHMPQDQSYKLYAFVEHSGDLRFGHYIAKIKSQDNGRWYRFDDLNVTHSDYEHFQLDPTETSENVYLLFYQRQKEQHADTSLTDIGRYYTPESSQAGVMNGTEDTHSSTEERERVDSNRDNTAGVTNAHKKEHGTTDKPVRPASKRGTVSEDSQPRVKRPDHFCNKKQKVDKSVDVKINRNSESSQDECHMTFQENFNVHDIHNHSKWLNNDSKHLKIPEKTHGEITERNKSEIQDFKVAHTWKEPNVPLRTQEPFNVSSNDSVNSNNSRHFLSDKQTCMKKVIYHEHDRREQEDQVSRRQQPKQDQYSAYKDKGNQQQGRTGIEMIPLTNLKERHNFCDPHYNCSTEMMSNKDITNEGLRKNGRRDTHNYNNKGHVSRLTQGGTDEPALYRAPSEGRLLLHGPQQCLERLEQKGFRKSSQNFRESQQKERVGQFQKQKNRHDGPDSFNMSREEDLDYSEQNAKCVPHHKSTGSDSFRNQSHGNRCPDAVIPLYPPPNPPLSLTNPQKTTQTISVFREEMVLETNVRWTKNWKHIFRCCIPSKKKHTK